MSRTRYGRATAAVSRYWNWKSAVLSILLRSPIWFFTGLRTSLRAATTAALTDAVLRLVMTGVLGAWVQRLARVRPPWLATLIAAVGVPAAAHGIEAFVHRQARTPLWQQGVALSIGVSVVSALFNLYAVRRGALIAGPAAAPLLADVRRLPRLLAGFVRHPFGSQ